MIFIDKVKNGKIPEKLMGALPATCLSALSHSTNKNRKAERYIRPSAFLSLSPA